MSTFFDAATPNGAASGLLNLLRVAFGSIENFMNGDATGNNSPTLRGTATYADTSGKFAKGDGDEFTLVTEYNWP